MRYSRFMRISLIVFSSVYLTSVLASEHTVDLVVGYKTINFTGKPAKAIAVNNQIPAPTLRFKEGDTVTLNVYNQLDKGTAIHWHGLLVPWQMDGVEHVSQAPIPPGGVFHYHFTLKQSGTYWYHAHADLQEQQGLYGAFIIDPQRKPAYHYTKDVVAVLSDWNDADPDQTYANLKKEGDYYSPKMPLQPSLVRFLRDYHNAKTSEVRAKLISDYKMMQQMRMSIYDISDVAYDKFLLNGHPPQQPWTQQVNIGDVVRLRFIDAGASTFFRVKIPGTKMQVVHVQGNDVKPYFVDSLTIAPAETYDVLVKITKNAPYLIYAESADTLGAAVGALVTDSHQPVNYKAVEPFPTPAPVTGRHNMASMPGMSHSSHDMMGMTTHEKSMAMPDEKNHYRSSMSPKAMSSMPMSHEMPMENPNTQSSEPTAAGTKYENLTSPLKTNDPTKPFIPIEMVLSGYMDRYVWFINGLPEYQAKPILIEPGKRYRITFINSTMMHHPMHIHGHWFILRNGHGSYDPLLHTVNVPPGATLVVDFDADTQGQWFFHCHNLYHMMAGMSRVFRYTSLTASEVEFALEQDTSHTSNQAPSMPHSSLQPANHPESAADLPAHAHKMGRYQASFLDIGIDPFHQLQQITFKNLWGGDYDKLELFSDEAEFKKGTTQNANVDLFYWRLIDQFWAVKGGVNYVYRPAEKPYWQPGVGIEGLMPYFIDTNIRAYYHRGSTKLDIELSRDSQITDNFFIRAGIRSILATKTVAQDEVGSGLNQMQYTLRPFYRLTPGLSLFAQYEHDQGYGAFKKLLNNNGESAHEDTIMFGVALLF